MVYARQVADQTLTFGVSGKLIMNALVMYDHQTESLWSQFLSLAVDGPLTGAKLELLPALQTDWETWRQLHPETLVLFTGRTPGRDSYQGYYGSGRTGILGESNRDTRLVRKELALGIIDSGKAKAYSFQLLRQKRALNDTLGNLPLLVVFDAASDTALAYDRRVDGRTLHLQASADDQGRPVLVDQETGSQWDAFTGEAIRGELEGSTLRQLPTHYSFWFAWTDFYPDTELYQP